MVTAKHRNELINRIKTIADKDILDEVYRLLEVDFDDSIYKMNESQKLEISQAKKEIKQAKGIDATKADRDIDEWLEQ